MHYTVKDDLVEQVAQRMNPGKYTWSERDKADLRVAASELLTFIEGFQRAADLQEKVSQERFTGILGNIGGMTTQGGTIRRVDGSELRPDRPYDTQVRTATGVQVGANQKINN